MSKHTSMRLAPVLLVFGLTLLALVPAPAHAWASEGPQDESAQAADAGQAWVLAELADEAYDGVVQGEPHALPPSIDGASPLAGATVEHGAYESTDMPSNQDNATTAEAVLTVDASGDESGVDTDEPTEADSFANEAATSEGVVEPLGPDGEPEASALASTDARLDEPITMATGEDGFSGKDAITLVSKLLGAAATGDPAEVAAAVVEWGTENLIAAIFGVDMGDDESLQQIMQDIKELKDELDTLQKTVNNQQLDSILNDLKDLLSDQSTYDVYNGLRDIDAKYKDGTYSQTEAEQRRHSELTGSLGVTEDSWESVNNVYDRFVLQLWTAMTDTYHVTINGTTQDLDLMQVHYEHLRAKYRWENQAYDEWSAFQARCVGLLTTSLNLEKSSLQARIALLKTWNDDPKHEKRDEGAVTSRLKTIQDYINQVSGYKGKDPYGNDVDYAGLFSEKTWADTYWLYKERPDVRYYWVPKHEILFYAEVNTQSTPKEDTSKGSTSTSAKGFTYPGHHTHKPTFKFWKPFIRYQGGNSYLVSYDQLRQIYADYNSGGATKSLYEIFMGDGAFTGLTGKSNDWQFVIDPDSDHPLTYEEFTFKADQIYVFQVDGMTKATKLPGAEHLILAYYHYFSSENNNNTNYIGIGVKRVGPESAPSTDVVAEEHTAYVKHEEPRWPSQEVEKDPARLVESSISPRASLPTTGDASVGTADTMLPALVGGLSLLLAGLALHIRQRHSSGGTS